MNKLLEKIDDIKEKLTSQEYLEIVNCLLEPLDYQVLFKREFIINMQLIHRLLISINSRDLDENHILNIIEDILKLVYYKISDDYYNEYKRICSVNDQLLTFTIDI